MRKLRIVFMGTPDFAVASLDAILKADYQIVAVITAPDKPAGRGRKVNQSAVKKFSVEKGLNILQPSNLKSEVFIEQLKALEANLQIVVAFRMLPKIVWDMPKYGTFNLHASLLPNYRGAAPINWAIINGETKTGVTTFFIDEKIDTGKIILQEEASISKTDTVGKLHDKLMKIGSKLVVKTIKQIESNDVKTITQPEPEERKAPKIFKETCEINWNDKIDNIYNLIRGLNPYPSAWSTLVINNNSQIVKIFDVNKVYEDHNFKSGTIHSSKSKIEVAVEKGYIEILSLQIAGKRRMNSKDLLNGFTFYPNSFFE